MENNLSEAICVIVTTVIAGVIRFFEKRKIKRDSEAQSQDHFKKL
jgi:hypothetical protein